MSDHKSIQVRVPATAANLGPGFDCLGLSLDIWNEAEFSFHGNSLSIEIEGEGADSLPCDESNLIFRCLQRLAVEYKISLPRGIRIRCKNRIPVSSGLGSSSAAIIAGLVGGSKLLEIDCPDAKLLEIGYHFEEHLDNIAACFYGGLIIAFLHNNQAYSIKISPKPLSVVIALPKVALSTKEARRVLPEQVEFCDAIFNISRTAVLVSAFCQGEFERLPIGMDDRLHQPYRYNLIPGAQAAQAAAIQAGALGAALSGAGPSLIALLRQKDDGKVAEAMRQSFLDYGFLVRIFSSQSTDLGAQIIQD